MLIADLLDNGHRYPYPRRCTVRILKALEFGESEKITESSIHWESYNSYLQHLSSVAHNPQNNTLNYFWEKATSFITFEDEQYYEAHQEIHDHLTVDYFRICKRAIYNYGQLPVVMDFFEIWTPYFQVTRDKEILAEAQRLYVMTLLVRRQNLQEMNTVDNGGFGEYEPWNSINNHTKIGNEPAIETVIRQLSQSDVIIDNPSFTVLFTDLMSARTKNPYPRGRTLEVLGALPLIGMLRDRAHQRRISAMMDSLEKISNLESLTRFIENNINDEAISMNWKLVNAALASYSAMNGPNLNYFKMYLAAFRRHSDRSYLIPKFVRVHQETLLNPKCAESFALSQVYLRAGFVHKQFHSNDYGENADEYLPMIRKLTIQLLLGPLWADRERAKDQLGLEILHSIYTNNSDVHGHRVLFPMESKVIIGKLHFDFRKFDGISDRLQIWWIIDHRLGNARLSAAIKYSIVTISCNEAAYMFIKGHLLREITHGATVDQEGVYKIICNGTNLYSTTKPPRPLISFPIGSEGVIWLMNDLWCSHQGKQTYPHSVLV